MLPPHPIPGESHAETPVIYIFCLFSYLVDPPNSENLDIKTVKILSGEAAKQKRPERQTVGGPVVGEMW